MAIQLQRYWTSAQKWGFILQIWYADEMVHSRLWESATDLPGEWFARKESSLKAWIWTCSIWETNPAKFVQLWLLLCRQPCWHSTGQFPFSYRSWTCNALRLYGERVIVQDGCVKLTCHTSKRPWKLSKDCGSRQRPCISRFALREEDLGAAAREVDEVDQLMDGVTKLSVTYSRRYITGVTLQSSEKIFMQKSCHESRKKNLDHQSAWRLEKKCGPIVNLSDGRGIEVSQESIRLEPLWCLKHLA